MKPQSSFPRRTLLPLAATLVCLASVAPAAQPKTKAPPKSSPPRSAATNAAPAEPKIASSVFVIPSAPQQGKDPFFPHSKRLFGRVVITTPTNQPPEVITVELQLKALSGAPGHRLAIINNHTFAVGEEVEIPTNVGRSRIRCLEIKDDSVLVQVGDEQRLLRLRPGI
jgi:hypothetical protein